MNVKQILDRKGNDVFAVRPQAPIREVTAIMAARKIGTVLVTDAHGDLAGIISERDIVRWLAEQGETFFKLTAADLITRSLITFTPSCSIH